MAINGHRFIAAFLLMSGFSSAATAGRVDHIDVQHDGDNYSVSVSAFINLTQTALRSLLTDYERVATTNDAIETLEILASPQAGITRLKAQLQACIWFFCKRLQQVQDMELVAAGLLQATLIPELSDFKSGRAQWRMIAEGEGSRLLFSFHVEPDFWVPPLIGPAVIKRKMRYEAIETVLGIERLAIH